MDLSGFGDSGVNPLIDNVNPLTTMAAAAAGQPVTGGGTGTPGASTTDGINPKSPDGTANQGTKPKPAPRKHALAEGGEKIAEKVKKLKNNAISKKAAQLRVRPSKGLNAIGRVLGEVGLGGLKVATHGATAMAGAGLYLNDIIRNSMPWVLEKSDQGAIPEDFLRESLNKRQYFTPQHNVTVAEPRINRKIMAADPISEGARIMELDQNAQQSMRHALARGDASRRLRGTQWFQGHPGLGAGYNPDPLAGFLQRWPRWDMGDRGGLPGSRYPDNTLPPFTVPVTPETAPPVSPYSNLFR